MSLNIIENILTKNDCYKSGRTITPTCMQLHTIGTGQNSASALASYWNQSGIQACVHYCIDAETEDLVLHFLPDNRRSWADGGYGNGNAITVELMESDYMKYGSGGASYSITNEAKFKADITRAYNTAVKFFALKCKEYGWNPQEKMSNGLHRVFSHDEGRRLGLSTAHVDPTHIWDRYGWTMDKFRADVAKAMGGEIASVNVDAVSTAAPITRYYRVRKSWEDVGSQLGAYQSEENAKADCPVGYTVFDPDGKAVYTNEPKPVDINTLTGKGLNGTEAERIAMVAPIYQQVMKETGMLASVGLAQFALESYYGQTDLGLYANNMHGMKCSLSGNTWANSVWDGVSKYTKKTAEDDGTGRLYYITADFRKYPNIIDSVRDRAAYFIGAWLDAAKTTKRYPKVNLIKDAETQVKLIKAGSYASDTAYVSKLMNIINRFNLTQYDKGIEPEAWDTTEKEPVALPDVKVSYYRVASDYKDGKYIGQTAAFTSKDNALAAGKASNLNVYDPNGKVIYKATKLKNKAYRVRCGRFSVKKNATNLINTLAANGIGAILIKDGEEWDVQVGLFNERLNAEAYVIKMKAKGFDAMIVEIEE